MSRSTPAESGPRLTKSPTPWISSVAGSKRTQSRSRRSSSQQPCTSPTKIRGPRRGFIGTGARVRRKVLLLDAPGRSVEGGPHAAERTVSMRATSPPARHLVLGGCLRHARWQRFPVELGILRRALEVALPDAPDDDGEFRPRVRSRGARPLVRRESANAAPDALGNTALRYRRLCA